MSENYDLITHPILNDHTIIAWDVDLTLVDGRKSIFWRRWLKDNREGRKNWIVTFRTDTALQEVWKDLTTCHEPLEVSWFEGLYSIPPDLAKSYVSLHHLLKGIETPEQVTPKLTRILDRFGPSLDEVIHLNKTSRLWKAQTCKDIGATVLVEDLEDFCKPGCDIHGIVFVNAITG
jgi:hypothetical protein